MQRIGKIWRAIEKLNRFIYTIGSIFILVLASITLIDVGGRFFFNSSLQGSLELSELTMAVIIFLCWGYAFSMDAHIKVDILTLRFHPRMKALCEVATSVLTIIFLTLLVWRGTWMAIQQRINTTDILQIPVFPFAMLIPIGSALAVISLIGHIASLFRILIDCKGKGL